MAVKNLGAASIWKTLSKIDCSSKTMEKGGLTYLPWNQAVTYMMNNYPEYTVQWHGTKDENSVTRDVTYYEGGTAMVNCSVTIGDVERECWLPVMDYRNKAIAHPSSRDISDAKQRCLVKCFALFGLGIYIYRGDAVPDVEDSEEGSVAAAAPPKAKAKPKKSKKVEEPDAMPLNSILNSPAALKDGLIALTHKLNDGGWVPDDATKAQIKAAVTNLDVKALTSLTKTLQAVERPALLINGDTKEND
tara:strand:+ start:569 stop:1309 length:741 start_codon:yes stop_codon:yes gene_type:complete